MLSPSEKANYLRDGYLSLKGFVPLGPLKRLSQEISDWQSRLQLETKNIRYRFKNRNTDGAILLDSIDPALDLFPSLAEIAFHPPLLKVLESLFGEPPCLFKDKIILKEPGVDGYPLHQDYIAWPSFPRSFTTVVLPIDAATAENGCIEVFPGVYHRGYLSPLDGNFHDLPDTAVAGISSQNLELFPGDLAIFGCLVPHRSAGNQSEKARRQLYLSYNRESDHGDARSGHYAEFQAWLLRKYEEFGAQGFYFK